MTQPEESSELETAVVAVYRGPLEEFISRRDAQVKMEEIKHFLRT